MKIQEQVDLKQYTSMFVGGKARYFVEVDSTEDIIKALQFADENRLPFFILGAGSNTLVSDSGFSGVVIKIGIWGKKVISETDEYVEYEVGAGENWDDFVKFAVDEGLYGIENMSHVPGTVGASVVQNVGCYGQEVAETVQYIRAINTESLENFFLQKSDLQFSYRKSRLNDSRTDKGKYVVTHVIFRLWKKGELNMGYGDIQKYFANNVDLTPTLLTLRDAIISIRNDKYPFPDSPKHGTCGSFWNVDVVLEKTYKKIIEKLQEKGFVDKAEEMIGKKNVFTVAQGYKIVPGLLVEVLGFKGRRNGGAKVLETHAGIINNFSGTATANDIFSLSKEITEAVFKEFDVKMQIEPELVGDFKII